MPIVRVSARCVCAVCLAAYSLRGAAHEFAGTGNADDVALVQIAHNVSRRSTKAAAHAANGQASMSAAKATKTATRKGSFLVIADWGWDPVYHGDIETAACQQAIAAAMHNKMQELGDVRFVINAGDSFYPGGVASKADPKWQTSWRDIYSEGLRSVPWYSVYGNHDWQNDPGACTIDATSCAQVNYDPLDLDFFQMPGYNYYKGIPDLDLEIVGLELGKFKNGHNLSLGFLDLALPDCANTPCQSACIANSNQRTQEAMDLLHTRVSASPATNVLVFSHYPIGHMTSVPSLLADLQTTPAHNIMYFNGHIHNTQNTTNLTAAPIKFWNAGGGGGHSCDGPDQGFVVGEILEDVDFSPNYFVSTYPVTVDQSLCCPAWAPPSSTIPERWMMDG